MSRSRIQTSVLGTNPVCDIFGQRITAACTAAIAITSNNLVKAQMQNAAATVTGNLFKLPAGPVAFVLGGEWRSSQAQYDPDFFLQTGDVAGFNPSKFTKGKESVREVFGEFRVPIFADQPIAKSLTANGAFRYSDYSLHGVGAVWTYSYGGDWRPSEDITFRGQFQHAIRAPNVGELFGGLATAFTTVTDPCGPGAADQSATARSFCISTGVPTANVFTAAVQPNPFIQNTSGGNPALHAETSDTTTYGVVLTPRFIPNLAFSVDYYSIDVTGAIAQLSGGISGVLNACYVPKVLGSIYCGAITRDPNTGMITNVGVGNANLGGLKTRGIDFEGNYTFDIGWRPFNTATSFAISTDWTKLLESTIIPDQTNPKARNECAGAYGPTCGEPTPKLKGVTRFTWTTGPLSTSACVGASSTR